ncbi:MAG: hypothetical protein WHT06_15860 [Desulfobacterales bacterium]
MNVIQTPAEERSSYFITVELFDEQGNKVTPASLKWKLTDMAGNVVNNRSEVTVSNPADANVIALSGNDLAVFEDAITYRLVTVWGQYYSPSAGGNVDFRQQIKFAIRPMIG